MDKHIRLLFESLFDDDFDDFYTDEENEEVRSEFDSTLYIKKLSLCTTLEMVLLYFFNKFGVEKNINTFLHKFINKVIQEKQLPFIDVDFDNTGGYNAKWHIMAFARYNGIDINGYCYCEEFKQELVEKTLGPVKLPKGLNTLTVDLGYGDTLCALVPTKQFAPATLTKINELNNKIKTLLEQEIQEQVTAALTKKYKLLRLFEELTCEGKVYKLTQKDIDRMDKCLYTKNFSGFDKITTPNKMVARLAALFIVAKKFNYTDMELTFNDDILISVICERNGYSSSRTLARRHDYIAILRKLVLFPSIHIKDVIATYKEYIDKF